MTVPPAAGQQPYYGQPYQPPVPTDPADAPIPGISVGGALVRFFPKYGRGSRLASLSEYWWMFLWDILLGIVLGVVIAVLMVPAITEAVQRGALSAPEDQSAAANALFLELLGRFVAIYVVLLLISLALLVPHLAVTVRRLHDSNRSGHFAWLLLVPSVGSLIVLILCLMPTDPYGQRFDRPLAAR